MSDNNGALEAIIKAFRQAEENLGRALETGSIETVRSAERRLSELHTAICRFPTSSFTQFSTQIRFLVDRIARQSGADAENTDYVELRNLLTDRFARAQEALPETLVADAPDDRTMRDNSTPFDFITVAELVGWSSDRVSIIGTDFRYLHTSIGNGSFYKTEPARIVGQHLGDIIGANRFETRAKSYLEASFARGAQDYTHSLQVDGRHHIMNCRMTPVRDRHNVLIGSLVIMRDMTRLYLGSESEYVGPESEATAAVVSAH